MVDAKMLRNIVLIINVLTAALLVGILPAFNIFASMSLAGPLTVGVVLGLLNFVAFYLLWKKRI